MHHYGLAVDISDNSFTLKFQNSHTRETINVMGPLKGTFENADQILDSISLQELGIAIQGILNQKLSIKSDYPPQDSTDYKLKIDNQVEKFFESKQKLIYFIITGSIAVVAFMANFLLENILLAGNLLWLIVISSVFGLSATGYSIFSLYHGLESYRLHLQYRYERKDWEDLNAQEKKVHEDNNKEASKDLNIAFLSLFLEIGLATTFFVLFFIFYQSS